MTQPNDPAFPTAEIFPHVSSEETTWIRHYDGLTKREYFAAMAMAGFMTNPNTNFNEAVNAQYAVKAADALIAELDKVTP